MQDITNDTRRVHQKKSKKKNLQNKKNEGIITHLSIIA